MVSLSSLVPLYANPVPILSIKNADHAKAIQSGLNAKMSSGLVVDGIVGRKTAIAWEEYKNKTYQADPELVGSGSLRKLDEMKPVGATTQTKPNQSTASSFADRIVAVCDKRGYSLRRKDGEINIVGIEGMNPDGTPNSDAPDQWNDAIILLGFKNGKPYLEMSCRGTTEPGRYYTDRPMNANGAARLQLGQHKGLWIVGQHKGYEAMQQIGSAKLVRDKNRNHSRDDKETIETGNGINLHTTKTTGWSGSFSSGSIGSWSAGCSVIQSPSQFLDFMKKVKASAQYRNNKSYRFDYTLLWKEWF